MKREVIETKADELVKYIYAKGEVVSALASEELNIPLDQIEEWAVPLEENNLIRVRYSPIHGMILVSRPISGKELDFKISDFKGRKEELKKQAKSLEKSFNSYSETLSDLAYNLKELEKAHDKEYADARGKKSKESAAKTLKELNVLHIKLQAYERELEELNAQKAEVTGAIDAFKKEALNVEKRAKEAEKSDMFGDFYRFLSEVERQAIKAKKSEDKFIEKTAGLRKRVDRLMPQAHMKYRVLHKKTLLDMLKERIPKKRLI